MTTRRVWLVAFGGLLATPFVADAKKRTKVWRVGFLASRHIDFADSDSLYGPFRQGMRELGYIEGKHFSIEWRSSENDNGRLPSLAAELVNLRVDVIVTSTAPAIRAAQRATTTIPIVMGGTADPVAAGFVKSLARPGGNITGLANLSLEMRLKQLEMLLSIVPKLSRVAVLLNPSNPINVSAFEKLQIEARKRRISVLRVDAKTRQEIDAAFASMRQHNADGLIVSLDAFLYQQHGQIAALAMKYLIPAVAGDSIHAENGVLMSYGVNAANQWRRAANYVDRIFKGAKPVDLPVEQPMRFELVINVGTAKALGLSIPQGLLVSANKVIE